MTLPHPYDKIAALRVPGIGSSAPHRLDFTAAANFKR